ncbi:MAG: MjaI family restriction endonuclease [Bacteroidota bacterium]
MLSPVSSDISPVHLRQTNMFWNQWHLNHPWSVGLTSELVRQYDFGNFDDWRAHYLQSGVIRDRRIADLSLLLRSTLEDHRWYVDSSDEEREQLEHHLRDINFHRGRSPDHLYLKAEWFRLQLAKEGVRLTFAECASLTGHRILTETWNGHVREINTILTLEKVLPQLTFDHCDGWEDYTYAIDFRISKDEHEIGAIQIKPETYLGKTPYLIAAQHANKVKNKLFETENELPVWTIISTEQGEILSDDNFIKQVKS